jgi:uncharacterized membrane protein
VSLHESHRAPADDAPKSARRDDKEGEYAFVGRSVLINRSRQDLYDFWRDFQNLPNFMQAIESIRPGKGGVMVWTINAPADQTVELETELISEEPGRSIVWHSTEASQIKTAGEVTFADAPGGRGTIVTASIAYEPPAGDIGRLVAKLFTQEPNIQARHELKRFKMLMETGEIAFSPNHRDKEEAQS